jgi:ATP-dependent Clp protease protease subunit
MQPKSINYYTTPAPKHKPKVNKEDDDEDEKSQVTTLAANNHPVLSRSIIFDQEINEMTATILRAEVMALAASDGEAPIFLFLGSPGGGLYESLAIYDTFQLIPNPIIAICSGKVMSGGILILLGCDIRLSTPNNTFMIHHGHTVLSGNVVQLNEQLKEIVSLNDRMLDIIIKKTKISREQLKTWLVKDHYMNTTDAVTHGLIDSEIESLDQLVVEKDEPPKKTSSALAPSDYVGNKKIAKKAIKKKVTKKTK